ncbi:MAG: hypothetical protein KDE56_01565 [Anaerolineales bacterium]|nr:hypothetical protein [Anaerolineales bacterium]
MTHNFDWQVDDKTVWQEEKTAVSPHSHTNWLTVGVLRLGTAVLGLWLVALLQHVIIRGYLLAGGIPTNGHIFRFALVLLLLALYFAIMISQLQRVNQQQLPFTTLWRILSITLMTEISLLLVGLLINRYLDIVEFVAQ